MLITVSGMVGSGKSTTAANVIRSLEEAGLRPAYLRFRYLKVLGFSKPERRATRQDVPERARGEGFTVRTLTAHRAAGYLLRVLAFRMSSVVPSGSCAVMDRYFYDNFAQYQLRSRRERLYAATLRRLIPVPDLALLLIARDDTIAARRPNYDERYVKEAGRRYRELPDLFSNLVRIDTDPDSNTDEAIRSALRPLLAR